MSKILLSEFADEKDTILLSEFADTFELESVPLSEFTEDEELETIPLTDFEVADPTEFPEYTPDITKGRALPLLKDFAEFKNIPIQLGAGVVRVAENAFLGGAGRVERIIGDTISGIAETAQSKIESELENLKDETVDIVLDGTLGSLNKLGEFLTKHGSKTSEVWTNAANTGWEAIDKSKGTPVANFIGEASESIYTTTFILAMGYLSGGTTIAGNTLGAAAKMSAQSKSLIAAFSALCATPVYEQIKDAGGTTVEALAQFGVQAGVEYIMETAAFGEIFQGRTLGYVQMIRNSVAEETATGIMQDVSATFHLDQLAGMNVKDSVVDAFNVAASNMDENAIGGALGAASVGGIRSGTNRYKIGKYTNLVNSAQEVAAAVNKMEATVAAVKQAPAEVEANQADIVHTMPDGTVMSGAEHEGSVKNSSRQVETPTYYHGGELKKGHRGVFVTTDKKVAAKFGDVSEVEITTDNILDVRKPEHFEAFKKAYFKYSAESANIKLWEESVKRGDYGKFENSNARLAIDDLGFEGNWQIEDKADVIRLKDASKVKNSINPYLNPDIDIHRVLADAEHGVTLAKEAMAQRITELETFETDFAKALEPDNVKPIKDTATEIGDYVPPKVKKPKSPKSLKIKGLEDDAGKKVIANLRSLAGSDKNFKKISGYVNSLGGVPADPQARQSFINDLNEVARTQKKFSKKLSKLEGSAKKARIFNPWVESRYSLAQAEMITGKPFRRLFLNIIGQSNTAADEVGTGMTEALDSIGIKKHQVVLNKVQADNVTSYLFEEDEATREILQSKLDEKSVKVVGILENLLQGPIANEVRQARWYKWNDQYQADILKLAKAQIKAAGKGESLTQEQFDKITEKSRFLIPRNVIDSVADYETVYKEDGEINKVATERNQTNAATQILKQGRVANEAGQLRDWISGQTWGTRAHFYMSESRMSDLIDYVDSQSVRELADIRPAKAGKLDTKISATQTRETQSTKKKSRTVIADVMKHWERVASFNAVHDNLVEFWDNFDSAIAEYGSDNISSKDISNVRKLLGTTMAKPVAPSDLGAITSKAGNLFWTAYFADISRSGRFAVRNLKQNIAYLSTQLSPVEMTKAIGRMAVGKGTSAQELSNFEEFWKSEISQKRQVFNHFIMASEASQTQQLGHKYSRLLNSLGSLAMRTDEVNRKVAWKMAYEVSTHNLDLYNEGKIDYKTLESRLKISTLNTSERLELKALLDTSKSEGNDTAQIQEEFIKRYTSMKTMNTHFGYDLKHKSLVEQDPGARQIIGPITYFRGRAQIINQSVLKPIRQAWQNKNAKQGREAIGNLFKFIVGSALAGKAAEKMGYEAYSLVSDSVYSPLSPGVGMAVEASQEIDYVISQVGDEISLEKSVTRIADIIGGLGELGVPMLNTLSQLYQAQNDVRGVTTMKRVQNLLYEQGWTETEKEYQEFDRTTFEKVANVLWGGFDKDLKNSD